eukprot:TRINITY_DN28006_c0_g1_i1.p2 TRINITY_DN28006_c0_g1~~TRINITY_DN28006_c0_g1_i1.p2  ORF type:complete len:113 (+),score=16.17 TRINITY_DN28006_c0_g1_i1:58-396(+)
MLIKILLFYNNLNSFQKRNNQMWENDNSQDQIMSNEILSSLKQSKELELAKIPDQIEENQRYSDIKQQPLENLIEPQKCLTQRQEPNSKLVNFQLSQRDKKMSEKLCYIKNQ